VNLCAKLSSDPPRPPPPIPSSQRLDAASNVRLNVSQRFDRDADTSALKSAMSSSKQTVHTGPPPRNTITIDESSSNSLSGLDNTSKQEDLPTLELLLKKILKSRKVSVHEVIQDAGVIKKEETNKPSQEEDGRSKSRVEDPITNSNSRPSALELLRKELLETRASKATSPIKDHFMKEESSSASIEVARGAHRNVATSPVNESYLAHEARKKKSYRKKKSQEGHSSSCERATCRNALSWIYPERIAHQTSKYHSLHHSSIQLPESRPHRKHASYFHQDASLLLANDTSMLKSLADIVNEMESGISLHFNK
jgi:hypothetical protein